MDCPIQKSFQTLHQYLLQNDFAGYEFDDILGSPLVRALTRHNVWLQRVAIQVGRRLIVNIRPWIGVKKLKSSKAFAYIIKGYLYHFLATGEEQFLPLVHDHLEWLQQHYCRNYSGMSWGNAFDFASRGGFFPQGLPTIVWTAHIAEAFHLAAEELQQPEYHAVTLQAAQFIYENLERQPDKNGFCFAYAPGILNRIHNANLLGAVTLLRAWALTHNTRYFDLAAEAIRWTCAHQNKDGSWYYGADPHYHWIDNFHTGYNLDCLIAAHHLAGETLIPTPIIEKTYQFWVDHFFREDGAPRYYHNRTAPIDIQCASQAIESLAKYSTRDPSSLVLARKVATWTIRRMQKKNGAFRFRRGRWWVNNLESIHWGQATMLSALGSLLYYTRKANHDTGDHPTYHLPGD
ncbi:MAG: hypothetical protein D6675_09330 [Gemmatimonadetes bacterium]|nr:MAG: hypothetical protein D6675_09330 [Gemmatimonadota bacterium]